MKFIYIALIVLGMWYFFGDKEEVKVDPYIESPNRTYNSNVPSPSSSYSSSANFNGYPCTDDCSGHEAGYEWAEDNGIDDPNDCDGNSESFIEGCQSYAEEQNGYENFEE